MTHKLVPLEPVAWRVMVRDSRTTDETWRSYAIYPTEKGARNTVKKIDGDPLEVMVQPLYTAPVAQECASVGTSTEVNARLLEAMKKAREEMAIGNFNSASERITHAIAAAEQSEPEPLTGWQPIETAQKEQGE